MRYDCCNCYHGVADRLGKYLGPGAGGPDLPEVSISGTEARPAL